MRAAAAPRVRVVIVNDFEVIVAGLARMLAPYENDIQIVEMHAGDDQNVKVCADVALFDSFGHADGGVDEAAALVDDPRVRRVVVYTWYFDEGAIPVFFERGVSGYLAKHLGAAELVGALRSVAAGSTVVSDPPRRLGTTPERDWPGRAKGLSEREAEVLALIADGHSNQEIADALYLSINSVKTHIRNAYRKLDLRNRAEAVRVALEAGLARRSEH